LPNIVKVIKSTEYVAWGGGMHTKIRSEAIRERYHLGDLTVKGYY